MARPAKSDALDRAPFHRMSDGEILLFVSRTLQPRFDRADATAFAKLQNLTDILNQQEAILPDLPHGAGKDRLTETVARAKTLLAQITDDRPGAAKTRSAGRGQVGVARRP
jgi:hypothetical protein